MAATEIKVQMQQRRDTAANWTSAGTVLLAGELGYETDTGYAKLGDGSTAWGSLAYLPAAGKAKDGTEALPGISFRDDASLGLYRPAADELGISTSGIERIRVASDGDIGIRTKTPAFGLHVAQATGGAAALFLEASGSAGNDAEIIFGEAGSTNNRGSITYPSGNHFMSFNTNGNNERMRLTSDGKIGFGASPASVNHEFFFGSSTTDCRLQICNSTTGTAAGDGALLHMNGTQLNINNLETGEMVFHTSDTTRMTILSGGNVGIGTTSPDYHLDVNGNIGLTEGQVLTWHNGSGSKAGDIFIDSSDNMVFRNTSSLHERMRIKSDGNVGIGHNDPPKQLSLAETTQPTIALYTGSTIRAEINATSAETSFLSYSNSPFTFNIGGSAETEAVRIDGTGQVGIGSTSPEDPLHIKSNSGAIRLENTVVSNNDSIISYDNETLFFHCDANNVRGSSAILFKSDDQDRMIIDDNGKVGIGESSPAAGLDVKLDQNPVLAIDRGSANTANFNLQYNGTLTGQLSAANADFQISAAGSTTPMSFFVNGGQRMQIEADGDLKLGTTSNHTFIRPYESSTGNLIIGADQGASGSSGSAIQFRSRGSNVARIDSAARLLMNTTTPLETTAGSITINEGTNGGRIALGGNPSGANSSLGEIFGFWNGSKVGGILITSGADTTNKDDGELRFYTRLSGAALAQRMHINTSGNVLIGGTLPSSPNIQLDANGNIKCAGTDIAMDDNGIFLMNDGNAGNGNYRARVKTDGSADFTGAVSKGSGSFKIDHPLKPETHQLVHSFVEGPQADNIYRGKVDLAAGTATVNIDTVAGMTDGTFVALNREVQCFTTNETGWTAIKGSVAGNLLTITAQDNTCTDTISWLVIGERQDQHMYDTGWTDENGKVIVEPEKPVVAS